MTNPDQPTVGDLTARLEFRYENDPLDFLKTGKGYLVVDDKVATIPLPTGEKGEKGDTGRLAEGDVRYFNHRTDEAVKAAEEAADSAESAKNDEVATRGHREHIDAQRQHVDAQKQSVDESAEQADADEKSAKASAEQAARDRAQTGADRTQTGQDRQAAQQARQHIDGQRQHFDSHIEHIDSQAEHVDAQAEHVDEQAGIATTKAEEASASATSAQEAADRLGSAETVEGWVESAEDSATRAEAAEAGAKNAVNEEIDKLKGDVPEAFDTLEEIVQELEANESERATLTNTLAKKSDKTYVDEELAKKADSGHQHSVEDLTNLPNISSGVEPGSLVQRSEDGKVVIPEPTEGSDPATVNYVNEKIGKTSYDISKDLGDLQRKVVKAQGSADRGLSEIEDLEIGGRNYFLPSQVGNLGLPEELSSEEGMVFGWASHDLATMKQEEELFGLTNGMLSTYTDFVQSPAFPRDYAQAAMDRGSDLLVSWEPWDWYGEPDSQPEFAPRRISAGEHDEWITSWLKEAQLYAERIPVHVRFAPEMNDTARPWAALKEAKGYEPATAEEYVEMWQHVWRIKELVAPDVKFMWNPLNFGAGDRLFEDFFPGSDYVDSVALNGFNWSNVQNPEGTWQSHDDVFGFGDDEQSPVNRLIALANGKPWGLAEVASAPADPADFEEGGQYYDAWGSWVFEWPENPPYEEVSEDWITQEGWTEMLIRRAYDKGASFLALFHTVKETDWRLTDTAKGRGVVQTAVDSGAKVKLGSSLDKNPDGELVTGASHRSFFLPVTPGERYTVSRTEASNNRFVCAFTGEAPRAGVKFVAPAGDSSESNGRLAITGVRVPEGASHMVLYLSSRGDETPKIMLEKGNRPSDWRPAPEETAEQTKEFVNKRPALFHGYGPPGVIEGAVPGDKYMDFDGMEIYLLPEENA